MTSFIGSEFQALPETGIFVIDQVSGDEVGYARGPERALISALLFDGIQAYLNYSAADSERLRTRFVEAFHWVHSRDRDYIFSFDNVCEALGLDADYVRLGLINVCRSRDSEQKKIRKTL